MLKLTSEHIEQIKKYFLATGEEEKTTLQKNITPNFLGSFLNDLKQLFIYNPNDENRLVSMGKGMGAEEHIEALKEIQQDYYGHLAAIFNRGESNADIELLLKVNNPLFAKEISYQSDIQKSFRLDARNELKKKFQEIDGWEELEDSELRNSFKLNERNKLKEQFKEIDKGLYEPVSEEASMLAEPFSEYKVSGQLKQASNVRRLNWKTLTVAATIIGVIAFAGFFVIRSGKQNTKIGISRMGDKALKDTNQIELYQGNESKELIAVNQLLYDSTMRILREQSFGSLERVEEIKVRVYVLNDKTGSKHYSNRKGYQPARHMENHYMEKHYARHNIDFLTSPIDTYTFDQGGLSIYLRKEAKLRIYKVAGVYFMKVNDSLYYINKKNTPTVFKRVIDKRILRAIEKIDFRESN